MSLLKKGKSNGGNDPFAGEGSGGKKIKTGGDTGGGRAISKGKKLGIKKIMIMALSLVLISCSVKHRANAPVTSAGNAGTAANTGTPTAGSDPNAPSLNLDNDGDGVKDVDEVAQGRNPFVAELPELKVRFLQNYKIDIFYHKVGTTNQQTATINTNVLDTNPDFKFRVGNVFARNNALKTAASFGRFSSHTSGKFDEHDLSWVSYPELDPKFFHSKAIDYRDIFNGNNIIENIRITLSNQVKLNESPFFHEIKDLKLNFYFLNHETENYDLLTATNIDRHFQSGVYESFDVVIDHAPVSLLKENFFKRGEFIISEVDNFTIPENNTDYKTLLASVKAQSIPVLYETPLDEKIYYVAASNGVSFQDILKSSFDKNYEVKEDGLTKIGQFQNNLPDFTHLKEIKDKDKLGKWFVMTNEFKENYLDRKYTPTDRIVLSYVTGNELATQTQENIYSYSAKIDGEQSESIFPLGNITPNSKVEFTLHPLNHYGRTINKQHEVFTRGAGSCGNNCVSLPVSCTWEINLFNDYNEGYSFPLDLTGEGDKLDLIVNGDVFKLSDLLKDKKIQLTKTDSGVHVSIDDISKIKDIKDIDENRLSLKVRSFALSDFYGIKLVDFSGYYQGFGGCAFNTPGVAEKYHTHLSSETREMAETQFWINQAHAHGWQYPIQTITSGRYFQEIALGVSSSIENLYN